MEIKQLATLLNQTIVPEVMGTQVNPTAITQYNATDPDVTVNQATARNTPAFLTYCQEQSLDVDYSFALEEDLSNYADLGTALSDLDETQLKTQYQNLLLGLRDVWVRGRAYSRNMPDIFIPAEEYGAVREIVMFGTDEFEIYEGRSLIDGQTYNQDQYIGTGEDARIYANESVLEVRGSIPNDQLKIYFSNAGELNKLVSGVMLKWDNTMNLGLEQMVQRVINSLIAGCDHEIKLVTMYNNAHSGANLTATTAIQDPDFIRWTSTIVKEVKKMMQKYNKVYNDQTIETFTPEASQHLTLLDMFAVNMETYLYANTYNEEYVKNVGKYDTVPYWQTRGNDLVPTIATAGDVNVKLPGELSATHIENVVGVLYDDYSCGVSLRAGGTNIRTHFNAKGDFTNYFYGQVVETFIDKRAGAVVFTLN